MKRVWVCEACGNDTALNFDAKGNSIGTICCSALAKTRKRTVLSLFSGIGGFDLGLERAGFEVVGQCEIDPFCNKVLARHWPEVPRYGDVRSIGLHNWRHGRDLGSLSSERGTDIGITSSDGFQSPAGGRPDLICGGFPCQDLSVAGKRAGLDGERSGLWFEFQRILQELRPSWAIIENVPGLLSSNQGRDFAVLLDGLGECGFGGIAWAVLDSQHFGVPQRRRRVYVVCGPTRRSVEQVLSLCEGCEGNLASSREAGEGTPGAVAIRTAQTGSNGHGINEDGIAYTLDGADGQAVLANSLLTKTGRLQLEDTFVPEVAYPLDRVSGRVSQREDQTTLLAHTLHARDHKGINAGHGHNNLVASTLDTHLGDKMWLEDQNVENYDFMRAAGAGVRRLTPVECERLQGFPDNWTLPEGYDSNRTGEYGGNRGVSDGPRYKALGNAVSVPVIEYLGRRILEVSS